MAEQMRLNGPWFVIMVPEADLPPGSMVPCAVVVEARDQEDAMKIGGFQSLTPGQTVYLAQAMVKVQPQFAITNLVEAVPAEPVQVEEDIQDHDEEAPPMDLDEILTPKESE